MAKIVFTPNVQRHVACPEAEVPGGTVREVLDNVLHNALTYSPEGGTIEVTIRPVVASGPNGTPRTSPGNDARIGKESAPMVPWSKQQQMLSPGVREAIRSRDLDFEAVEETRPGHADANRATVR